MMRLPSISRPAPDHDSGPAAAAICPPRMNGVPPRATFPSGMPQ